MTRLRHPATIASPKAKLILEDQTVIDGFSFGFSGSAAGEVVFNTGMVGYPEALTDPSYAGQILVLTYPLIGNYGVPKVATLESERIRVAGLVVGEHSTAYHHHSATHSLADWLKHEKIPAITGVDTRAITRRLRERGVMLGKLIVGAPIKAFVDPNTRNLVAEVSVRKPKIYGGGKKQVIAVDCGIKENSIRMLTRRGVSVLRVPWNYDFLHEPMDGLFLSNGPGDPVMCAVTIENIRRAMQRNIPIFGICLGNQLLGLAAGGKTYKLKYGHRSQNQPVVEQGTRRGFITSQNHGYALSGASLSKEWRVWFENGNDGTVEGIRHARKPWFAVQFHPEAAPGPTDTEWLFDEFVSLL